MTRVLIVWAEDSTPNLGLRVLAEGMGALIRRLSPRAEVVTQSYGHGPGPINIGIPRSLLREAVLDSRGARGWVKSFDLVVDMRAGDSFADIYGVARLRAQSAFAEFVRFCGVPLVMGPQTIGPFRTRQGRALARHSLRRAALVMSRDHVSAEAADALGRPVDVRTTDVVFALPAPEPTDERDVVVNVSGLLWDHDNHGSKGEYRQTVRRLLVGLGERGRRVTLLSHVLESDLLDQDSPAVLGLAAETGLEAVVPRSLAEARSVLRSSRLVFGSRMHACLNSLSVGTPAIPLAYSRKFAPLLGDLGWPHVVSLTDADPAATALAIVDAHGDLASAAARVRERAHELLRGAEAGLGSFL